MFKRVYIEISNVCNLKCSFCPEVGRARKVMDSEMFRRVLADVKPHTEQVCLHLMGEPLGHPEFPLMIAIAAEQGVPVNLTTNGTLLNAARRTTLLHPTIRQVNISVQSFEANFGPRDVAPYTERVFAFTRLALAQRPDLYINLRLWDLAGADGHTEENNLIRAAIEKEFGVAIDPARIDIRRRKNMSLQGRVSLHFDSRFTWPSLEQPVRAKRGFCHGLGNHLGIHADGTVVPCCLDKEAVIRLGNVNEQPLADILAGPRATGIREGFAAAELREALCQRCQYVSRFDRKAARMKNTPVAAPVAEKRMDA